MRWRWLLSSAVLCVATACATKDDIRNYAASKADVTEYSDSLYRWLRHLGTAVCQIEEKTTGLNPAKRQCPGGGDTTPPPKYPPP